LVVICSLKAPTGANRHGSVNPDDLVSGKRRNRRKLKEDRMASIEAGRPDRKIERVMFRV